MHLSRSSRQKSQLKKASSRLQSSSRASSLSDVTGRSGSDEDGEDEESFDDSDNPENQVEAVDLDDDDDAIDRGAKPAAPEFDLEFEQTLQVRPLALLPCPPQLPLPRHCCKSIND